MLQEVINLQKNAVKSLISVMQQKDEITFKAPTGSGKTYMMADLMNQVLEKNEDIIFLVSSLSKGNLAKQNYEKFCEYTNSRIFQHLNPYLINSDAYEEERLFIPLEYNVYILPRDLYKENGKLKKGVMLDFLYNETKTKGKKIFLIKDECHQKTSNLDNISREYFSKIFNFSATPNLARGQNPDVEINESEAVNAKLIKGVVYEDEKEDLEKAILKFENIKEQYNSLLLGIKPCMIIQISNKDKAEEELEKIFDTLNNHQSLKWMLIVDKEKDCDTNDVFKSKKMPVSKWKDYAKTNMAQIDIIIFKMVITEGWDIPRACMLYQVRDSRSVQLDEQVIGRIRRNPRLIDYEKLTKEQQELVTKAFVWGIPSRETKKICEVNLYGNKEINEIQSEIQIKTTRLKRISEIQSFDISKFLEDKSKKLIPTSIFDLYLKYLKLDNETRTIYENYIDDYAKWFSFMENTDEISKESKNFLCDYNANMEVLKDENGIEKEVSFPTLSYYIDNGNYKNINNWIWKRKDLNEEFSFDSEAEREWAEILINLISEDSPKGNGRVVKHITFEEIDVDGFVNNKKYLVGKNYLTNSEIKFEYYLKGIHSSYPDFIMKDYKNRIHLFEVKSLNKSSSYSIDDNEYKEKVIALKECYKYSSKLIEYYFYIPIKKDDKWTIYQFYNGEEKVLSKKEFINFFRI